MICNLFTASTASSVVSRISGASVCSMWRVRGIHSDSLSLHPHPVGHLLPPVEGILSEHVGWQVSCITPPSDEGFLGAQHVLKGDEVCKEGFCFSIWTEVGEDSAVEVFRITKLGGVMSE